MSTVIAYCSYCKAPINEGDKMVVINGEFYHYDPNEPLNNCYFPSFENETENFDE